jgi:hypothetical protein
MQRRTNKYLFRVRKSLIRQFFGSPKIFYTFLAKLQRKGKPNHKNFVSTELCLKIIPKVVSLPRIYLVYKLNQSVLTYISREDLLLFGSFKSTKKKMGPQIANPQILTFAEGPLI